MSSRVETGDAGAEEGQRPEEWPPAALADRLGFLLKHAQIELAELAGPAVAPLGIVRTTMVALLDALEAKGLVERHPHPGDRRRNLVELTARGRQVLDEGTRATREAERRFLAPLGDDDAARFRDALRTLIVAAPSGRHPAR